MNVFVDTKVLVSAFTALGPCAHSFRYLLAEHDVLTGEVNVAELRHVLKARARA